ncbi:heme transporter HRG1 isoform X1 [Onychostruthus taczanowskii]|uniref:heme transporter HRG1 isoform X1 n=1 Tax=Onychostruthus taczanowskii TaxID=356909 RepID=UPI001B80333F|nr:heme transporter HRG1 isoform X1 [Onychostruthus taczanowskii]
MKGPCGSHCHQHLTETHWGGLSPSPGSGSDPDPTFPARGGIQRHPKGATGFLHFPNLLSRCGEGGSGASKAPDEPRGAGDPPGGFGGREVLGTLSLCAGTQIPAGCPQRGSGAAAEGSWGFQRVVLALGTGWAWGQTRRDLQEGLGLGTDLEGPAGGSGLGDRPGGTCRRVWAWGQTWRDLQEGLGLGTDPEGPAGGSGLGDRPGGTCRRVWAWGQTWRDLQEGLGLGTDREGPAGGSGLGDRPGGTCRRVWAWGQTWRDLQEGLGLGTDPEGPAGRCSQGNPFPGSLCHSLGVGARRMKCTGTDRSVSQTFQDTGMSPHVVSLLPGHGAGFALCSPAGKNQQIPQIPPQSQHPEDLEESLRRSSGLEPGIPKECPGSQGPCPAGRVPDTRTRARSCCHSQGILVLQPGLGLEIFPDVSKAAPEKPPASWRSY